MSAIQPGGNRGSGQQRPGGRPPQRPSGNRRPSGTKPGQSGRGQQPGAGSGGKRPAARQGTPVPGSAPRRFSPSAIAFGVIGIVVVVVVALIVVKVTGGSSPSTSGIAPVDTPAPAALVAQVTNVPTSVLQTVGVPGSVNAPSVAKDQTPLTIDGKPGALFIGGEFCPYCAAERWAMVVAFSKFGTFSNLQVTTSSPWDTDPATATFSFHGASYSSPYLTFQPVEEASNDTNGLGTRHVLTALTTTQSHLWSTYSSHFGTTQGFPFLDIGNKVFVLGPSYNPAILAGLDQNAIAAKLSNASDPVTQSIIGAANYIIAGLCSMTGQQPGAVCSAPGTTEAAKALGLS
ncbi:MAG: DUF929 family protein [Acidimicrobiales bacterium]